MSEQRRTVCNRDCPDACSILATVEDGRVTRLAGDPSHPVTQGFLCPRTRRFLARQYSPDRVVTPLLRGARGFEPISWDSALDLAASRLAETRERFGAEAIFHYRSGGSLGMLVALTDRFFAHFGPCAGKRGDVCSGAGEAAQEADFGVSDSSALDELERSRNILLWGKNVTISSPHLLPTLRRAAARGARLALVDPVVHGTAEHCERAFRVRPGGDVALAMAVADTLFARAWTDPALATYCDGLDGFRALVASRSREAWCAEAGVSTEDAEDLARRLHEGPTAILVGWGMGRRSNGGSIVRALDALGLISGNVGRAGGGVSFYFRRRGAFDKGLLGGATARTFCEPRLGQELLEATPPVRAMWITAANPVVMLGDSETTRRALESIEFLVVADSFLTDTARLATLVLPTPTLLESDDLVGSYGHSYLGASRPVVAPPPGVRSDLELMQGLAERLGLGDVLRGTAAEWKERLLSPETRAAGVTVAALETGAVKNPLAPRVLFEGRRFPTETGRARLMTELGPEPPRPSRDFPLLLHALSTADSQCSQWSVPTPLPLECVVHPDALPEGVASGDACLLESALGALRVRVRTDPRQHPSVARVPKGGSLAEGAAANALTRAALTDLGEGAALYDETVRLVPLG